MIPLQMGNWCCYCGGAKVLGEALLGPEPTGGRSPLETSGMKRFPSPHFP
jgi:hypothetical protein